MHRSQGTPVASLLVLSALAASSGAQTVQTDGDASHVHARRTPGLPGEVLSASKISNETLGFDDLLEAGDQFGSDAVALGDVDGDGIVDLAVGARGDGSGFSGAVWIPSCA